MYTAKDASVAFSLMEQRLQPSNTALLMEEYFTVCRLYGDTSVARDTHQRYVTQIESMRSILSTQTLRNSEHEAFRGNVNGRTASAAGGAHKTAVNGNSARDGSSSSSSSAAATTGAQGSSSTVGRSPASSSTAAGATRGRRGAEHEKGMQPRSSDSVDSGTRYASDTNGRGSRSRAVSGVEASRGASRSGHPNAGQQPTAHTTSGLDGNTRNAASYAILRREWGHENYEEQFHKPWNAFLGELSAVMTEVVTAWVSDLDECTHYSRHLVWRSSTCCYDAAHGMCLLRWNTMREVRAYVDALHAVVNAPLSSFFVPLALAVQVLGVPVLCLSLAPVTGPWQGWDSVGVVWHSFCGLCANLRLMRPLDRAEGGRSEVGNNAFLSGLAGSAAHVDAAAGSATAAGAAHNTGGLGSALDGSVAWSLLRQLEPATASGDAYYGANTNSSSGGIAPMTTFEPSARHFPGATAAAWEQRRHSVFYGEPTSLANAAVVSSRADRVGRQVLTAAAAGQGGPFTRSGGLHLLAAIGGDARWYFVDARAICLYQWYARSSWMAARVPRREMFFGGNGCVQRSVGPNKLILQSKLRIMVGQLLNGLMRFSSAATHASSLAGGGSYMLGQRTVARGRPPVLLSTLCHSHGVRYGTYVYAIVDLLRTEEASLDEAVQTAYRLGSAAPNKLELLKQCRRCLQAIVGELVARVIKHLIYEEWYVVMRQNPDWLHRFHSLCTAVAEAEEAGAAATAEAEAEVAAGAESAGVPHTASASCDGKAKGASLSKGSGTASAPAASCFSSAGETEREEANRNAGSTVAATAAVVVPSEAEAAGNPRLRDESAAPTTPGEPAMVAATGGSSGGDGIRSPDDGDDVATDDASTVDDVSAVLRQRRLLQFIAETRESLGAPLLDAVRRVLNGVFIVNLSSSSGSYNGGGGGGGGGGGASSFYSNSPSVDHNLSLRAEGASGLGNVLEQAGSDASASAPASASAAAALVTAATPTASAAAASALHASLSGGGVSITEPSSRFTTDEAGRSLATSSAQALGGYPMFNPQLSSVAFRRSMFEELMLAVNERYVARVYSGNEKMSEWQLLHKRAPVVVRRSQFARSPSSTSGTALGGLSSTANGMTSNVGGGNNVTGGGGASTGGGATSGGAGGANNSNSVGGSVTTASAAGAAAAAAAAGTGNGNGGNNSGSGAESWSARTAGRSTVLGSRSASAPPPPTSARGRTTTSRLRGAIPVYYPAADEESIQAEAKDLFPGWSLQCLEEMIGVPLVLRQNRVDVDSSFTGAALLRALSPAFLSGMPTTAAADVYSADHAHRRPYGLSGTVTSGPSGGAGEAAALTRTMSSMTAAAAAATLAVVPPLTPGCPLRSAVWGTTLELPLCLSSGTIEGALDYAQHQREIGMAIVASGMSAPVISHGRHGTSSTVWRERNPHMEYMGKLIQLHSADVRIACRGWPIVEDFDFLKPMEPSGESMLSGGVGRPMWPRQRSLETALAHRHNVARLSGVAAAAAAGVGGGDARGSLGQDLAAVGASTEEARIALCFNASMHVRLSTLSARIDLHEAMSAMWQLTECIESMNGSHAVYGYLLRQKIDIIATVAANFTASGVTTALEAAIADLDVLTGGMFNFSSVDDMRGRNGATPLRLSREDESGVNSYGRRVGRYDGRAASRSALGSAERRPRFAAMPSSLSPSSFPGEEADAASALPGTPDGSQAPTVEPAQQQQPAAHGADTDSAAVNGGSVGDTDAAGLSMDRLRSLPVPPPITPRQVAAVTAAARRAGHSADAANPLALRASLTDTGRPTDVLASATPTPLVGSLGAFKSFLLRSVQCVDLYSTLLELLTRHMLLPDTRRTPKESLSRAVMFCSLRRELIVMTHGESSVEAAMAASDVGLLLLQSPKTWSQAKTEFYRARRSLAVHLRAVVHSGNGRGGSALAEAEGELTTSGVSGFALESHGGGGGGGGELLSGHPGRLADSHAAPGGRQRAHGIDMPGGRSPAHSQASRLASSSSSPLARHGAAGALTPLPRESWATAPDRLKQALCSVLNNIAYLYCRQAQRQYAVSQQSMSAYIRAARRHNTLHKASTGLALYERRQRRAAKVEHLLNEATATLRGVLSHAADTPAYDYAVALNNQASVLLHRYQYAAARRLLLQSLRITTQLQSFSVAPVTLPPSLVSPQGSGELGSVLWLLEPVQLQLAVDSASTTAARSQAYGDQDDDDGMLASRGTPPHSAAPSSTSKRAGVGAGAEPWPSTLQSRTPQRGGASLSGAKGDADKASFTPPSSPRSLKSGGGGGRAPVALRREAVRVPRAPNALTVIAAMLKDLGAPLDEDGDGTSGGLFFSGAGGIGNSGSGDGGAAAYEYYYAAGGAAPRDGRATAIDRATATAAAAAAPISISAAEQLRNCQVHTLRMLYQLEVQKSYIERLRVQRLFRRYLAAWRVRRETRRIRAAAELYRFGVGAMTRVFLARRYRFSGYHWWMRQPGAIRRHLDPLLDQAALTTRRQLWDVWNAQVETSVLVLQRVLRAAAVRRDMAAQFQFRQFYFQRCRPAVEAAVWAKMNVVYSSVLLHLHVQDGVRRMAALKETVLSGAMWLASATEPLQAQEAARRVGLRIHELQRREALERDSIKTLSRLRRRQLQVEEMKESVLIAIRSPRPSIEGAPSGGAPTAAVLPQPSRQPVPAVPPLHLSEMMQRGGGVEARAAWPPHGDPAALAPADHSAPHGTQTDVAASAGRAAAAEPRAIPHAPAATPLVPYSDAAPGHHGVFASPSLSDAELYAYGGDHGLAGLPYTPPAAFNTPSSGSAIFASAAGTPATATTAAAAGGGGGAGNVPPSPTPTSSPMGELAPAASFSSVSRARRARQVVIQADTADLEAEVAPSPRSTHASEERHRQMQRQYREDERVKMSQLLRQLHSHHPAHPPPIDEDGAPSPDDGDWSAEATHKTAEKSAVGSTAHDASGGRRSPVSFTSEDANMKWRQARQRAGAADPWASITTTPRSESPGEEHRGQQQPAAAAAGGGGSGAVLMAASPGANREADSGAVTSSPPSSFPAPFTRPAVLEPAPPGAAAPRPQTPPRERRPLLLPQPISGAGGVVDLVSVPASPAPSSPAASSAAVSTSTNASSRVAVAAAEAQRHQLEQASHILLQFWWTKRALPTYVTASLASHRLYCEHMMQLHALWVDKKAVRWRARQITLQEARGRYTLWQEESVEAASLLLLQVHGARCCRDLDSYAKWLRTTATTAERRGRSAVMLAVAPQERLAPLPPPA